MDSKVTIIIPLFNEQKVLPHLFNKLDLILNNNELEIDVLLINDGSNDDTENIISLKAMLDHRFSCINFSRNFGHQNAITAGLNFSKGLDAVMIIDGDLQDPPELVFDFYELINQGYDIINAIRKKRKENFVKKFLYWCYYRILNNISTIDQTLDSGDFCMIKRNVVDVINSLPENNRYVRGLRSWVGFKHYNFEYERSKRVDGESKYSFNMLFKLAYNGIFGFSKFPVKFISKLGFSTIFFSLVYITVLMYMKIYHPSKVPQGFTSLIFMISIFCGVQLVAIGILGEYIVRTFDEIKNRPNYIIKSKIIYGERIL